MDTVKNRYTPYAILRFVISSLTIILLGYFLVRDLPNYMDILMWDDINYMLEGLKFPIMNKTWGPLYGFWFKMLSLFESDPIALYYLNAQILIVLNALLIFWMLSRLGFSEVLSFLLSISFLISGINIETWPRVSHFCMLFVSTAIIVVTYIKPYYLRSLFCAVVALLISYARSEYYLAFIVFVAIGAYQLLVYRKDKLRYEIPLVCLLVLIIAVLHLKMGISLNNGGRSTKAFAQHFALNYFNWHHLPFDWWLNWEELYVSQFGQSDSFFQILKTNPMMFFNHIGSNVVAFITYSLYGIIDFLVPPKVIPLVIWLRAMIAIVLLGTVFVFFRRKKTKAASLPFGALFVFTIPAFIAITLIYPREHYLITLVPLVIVFIAYLMNPVALFSDQIRTGSLIVLCALLIFLKPSLGNYEFFNLWRPEQNLSNIKALKELKQLSAEQTVNMLENEGGLCKLLSGNCNWILAADKDQPFFSWIEEKEVNVIYVSRHLKTDPRYFEDEEWNKFLLDPELYGYNRLDLDGPNQYLLVK